MASLRDFLIAGTAALVLALPAVAQAQTSASATANVNLRAGPGTDYARLAVVPQGAQVSIDRCLQGVWCWVNHNGQSGWVSASFLQMQVAGPPLGQQQQVQQVQPQQQLQPQQQTVQQQTMPLTQQRYWRYQLQPQYMDQAQAQEQQWFGLGDGPETSAAPQTATGAPQADIGIYAGQPQTTALYAGTARRYGRLGWWPGRHAGWEARPAGWYGDHYWDGTGRWYYDGAWRAGPRPDLRFGYR